ncbi:M20/M25/M40 family metallo-hydrolase [Sphingomonas sp.]|uniref:M20/M25/M40 family metallo-hydrolase n=1 Tax=Sphingomonas sp. TaxID=28214 RepID=UPI003B00DDC2
MIESRGEATGRLLLCLLAAIVALWIAASAARPPAPLAADAPASAFSAARAMLDVRAIGMRPHPAGTTADDEVAAALARRLQQIGLRAELRHYLADEATAAKLRDWSGGAVVPVEITDVTGVLPGRDRAKPPLILMAHHDTVWGSPGAADDSAGCAAILEIVRAIRARGVPARDVVALFTDAEETGLHGAKAFWAAEGLAARAGAVINLESRGSGGRATMFETGTGNGDMMRLFARSVERPLANSLMSFLYKKMPNNTDFSVPRDRGTAGLNFAYLGRARYYHSPLATADRLDPATVQDMGGQALGIASALAFADVLPARAHDIVYFDLPGGRLVHYPAGRGWLVLLAAAALLGVAWRRTRPSLAALAGGVGGLAWTAAHAVLLLTILNLMSGSGGDPNYYDRLAALPRLEWQAALALVATLLAGFAARGLRTHWLAALPAAVLTIVALRLGAPAPLALGAGIVGMGAAALLPRRASPVRAEWTGMLALLLLVAAIVQVAAPLAAWVFAWPALVLAGVAAVGARPWLAALAAVAVTAPLLGLAHLVFLGLGAPYPAALVPFALPVFAAFWPIARIEREVAGRALVAAVLLLVVAAAIAHRVARDPLAVTVPAYSLRR